MKLSFTDIQKPATAADWMRKLMADASSLGLRVTAWQVGSVARAILGVVSYSLQLQDVVTSLIGQGGFLDSAATGKVTYLDARGVAQNVPVTVEGGPGWLDVLAQGTYDVERIQKGFAGGSLALTNTSVTTYGPFLAGTYHATNPSTKQGYTTTQSVTVPPSTVIANVSGVSNASGAVQITTDVSHGLTDDDIVTIKGAHGIGPLQTPAAWRVEVVNSTTFLLRGSKFSGSYTGGGIVYLPTLTTLQADTEGSAGDTLNSNGVAAANTVTQSVTSLVGVTISNVDPYYGTDVETNVAYADRTRKKLGTLSSNGPKSAYEFLALSADKYAAKLSPPQFLSTTITRETTATDLTTGTVYVFAANASGAPSDGDIGVLNAVIQAWGTPNAVTAFVVAPTRREIKVDVEVWLPAGYNTAKTRTLFQEAIQAYFETFKIGGISDPGGLYSHVLPLSGVIDAIEDVADENKFPLQDVVVGFDDLVKEYVQLAWDPTAQLAEVAVLSPAVPTVRMVSV